MLLHQIKVDGLTLKNNIFIAPLAGYTNLPTRLIYREQGECLAFAEMISAVGLEYSFKKSSKLAESGESDKPLGIQLFGPDAEKILKGFLKIKDGDYDIIDLNCGCSIKKILKSDAGAALLKDPEKIYRIIKILKNSTDRPVSLKIRSGWDENSINYPEVLDAGVKGGASLITFHPRTRAMLFGGRAKREYIRDMKSKSPIPVIGNGDILKGSDAVSMIGETGCDGVMLARGLIENPFLLEETIAALSGRQYTPPSFERRITTLIRHCRLMVNYFGERTALVEIRKFNKGYLKGMREVSRIRQRLNTVLRLDEFEKILSDYCKAEANQAAEAPTVP